MTKPEELLIEIYNLEQTILGSMEALDNKVKDLFKAIKEDK